MRTAFGDLVAALEADEDLTAFVAGSDAALTDACQLVLCLNEFIYVD